MDGCGEWNGQKDEVGETQTVIEKSTWRIYVVEVNLV